MANLKAVAQKIDREVKRKRARASVVLSLPVAEGRYAARFGLLPDETLDEFEALMERKGEVSRSEANDAAAQLLADACRGVLARDDGPKFEKLEHDDGRRVGFDEDFAAALDLARADGQPIESAADVVLALFTVADEDEEPELNSVALNDFAIRVLNFCRDTSREVEGEVVEGPHGGRS